MTPNQRTEAVLIHPRLGVSTLPEEGRTVQRAMCILVGAALLLAVSAVIVEVLGGLVGIGAAVAWCGMCLCAGRP